MELGDACEVEVGDGLELGRGAGVVGLAPCVEMGDCLLQHVDDGGLLGAGCADDGDVDGERPASGAVLRVAVYELAWRADDGVVLRLGCKGDGVGLADVVIYRRVHVAC